MKNGDDKVSFLAHSHLDAAWLWTFKETIEVFHDTCETVLRLMETYPSFYFCQSSAQYYKWLEESYPETFTKIKRRIEEGRWEVVGGTWIEPDGNLPSGESFVRQFLYGKRYFKERFGLDIDVAWFPDSFGLAWTLPQIMKKSGINFFLTQKMNWNDTTCFPYYFFKWIAPDGSSVYAHQTVGTYHESVDDAEILEQMARLDSSQRLNHLLLLFGVGDHGGGLTREMIERASEYVQEKKAMKGIFTTAKGYFHSLEKQIEPNNVPEINDELYLQFHRGTYTTISNVKKNNRRAECLLEIAEKYSTLAQRYNYQYHTTELKEAWELLLLNQFHDVLPGSAIPEVYDDSEKCFQKIFSTVTSIIAESLRAIASQIDTSGKGYPLLVFNPLSWPRNAIVEVPLEDVESPVDIYDEAGHIMPSQETGDGKIVFSAEAIPSIGYKQYRAKPGKSKSRPMTDLSVHENAERIKLENEFLVVEIDKATGFVSSIFDKKARRDALQDAGNVIQIFEDYPVRGRKAQFSKVDASRFDAWEIFIYQQPEGIKYIELNEPLEITLLDDGPVMARVSVRYLYAQEGRPDSTFRTEICLYHKIPWVEFNLHVDWHAEHRLAKVTFPLNVQSDFTAYEIPYGYIKRRNPFSPNATLSERAKYEVPGQKWIDHTNPEGSYGVSLLNDSKYGFDVVNNSIRMTLLRSATFPTELRSHFGLKVNGDTKGMVTDQGTHQCIYGLYPHISGFDDAGTTMKSYELNYLPTLLIEPPHKGSLPRNHSFISVQPKNIILTTIKKAEDSDGIILRLYESSGKDTEAVLEVTDGLESAVETDLLEHKITKVSIEKGTLRIPLHKHEIKTIIIQNEEENDG
jgi:alpha-mannosidase